MNINDVFGSYLKAEHIGKAKPVLTIQRVDVEELGKGADKEKKPVVYFENKDRGLVLNRTNANMLIELFDSHDTDDWIGQRIRLVVAKVDFQGRRVDAIRIEAAPNGTGRKSSSSKPTIRKAEPEPEPEPDEQSDQELTDDDIPF